MSFLDAARSFFSLPLQERALEVASWEFPNLETQLARAMRVQTSVHRIPSIREALGVPAIFGAVNMLSNLTGSMSMKALRNQVELAPDDRPRLIVRPTPGLIPREFYGGTTYNLATRGEAWWWVGKRDIDGSALSLYSIPPQEVVVEPDPNGDFRYPVVKWRDKTMNPDDFVQLVYSREPGALRGSGPLQMCGAAISVAVEAQQWAANFFASGGSSTVVKTAIQMDETEAEEFLAKWMNKAPNTPRIISPQVEAVEDHDTGAGGQMLDSRGYQNAEVATMFGMDATLLNAAISGSAVTYQNVGNEFEKLLRQCLQPHYLEVIEQTMSDFLPRTTVARFNTDTLTLADIKTRYEVYGIGIDKGIIDSEEARSFEGLAPGDVENAAIPISPPQAIPFSIPLQARSEEVRCSCGKLLAELAAAPYRFTCPRCKASVAA